MHPRRVSRLIFKRLNQGDKNNGNEPVIPPSEIQFWTFLLFQVPSMICTLFILYHLLANRTLRHAMHNHVIIILLLLILAIEIFDNPLYIDAYRHGGDRNSFPMTTSICLMWWFFDYGFYGAITVYLAWGSFERHLLVFHHDQCFRTVRQRLLVHYIPLAIIGIYLSTFYFVVIIYPPCENQFDFSKLACGLTPCYESIAYLNIWDYAINGILCSFIEACFSVALLIRILLKKRRLRQTVHWRKHHRMAVQLLSISLLSLLVVIPQSLIIVVQHVGSESLRQFGSHIDPYLFYFYTFIVFLFPFICLGNFPELWWKSIFLQRKHRRRIGPVAFAMNNHFQLRTRPQFVQ